MKTSGHRRRKRFGRTIYHSTIKDWPEGERPREKMLQKGAEVLTEAELLAILIRTGAKGSTAVDLAKKLLADRRSLRNIASMHPADFLDFGIGPARATSIVAAFELLRRTSREHEDEKPIFRTPAEIAKMYLGKFRDLKHEEFWSLLLSSSNRLIAERRVTLGTLNTSLVHPRECFQAAIRESAASVIFLHNHPSGNPEPSAEDLAITKQLVEAGKILGIPVHDHIILAGSTFTSLAERALL